jgi:hypothetical protein
MNALFKKDLRENFKLAIIGLIVLGFLFVLYCRHASPGEQPLLHEPLLATGIFFCAIFGSVLGWFQARNEATPDLWAFLVHRPITRTQIFRAKTEAGLCLYLLGAGLPFLGLLCYVVLPGSVAAPFEPSMILPSVVVLLMGIPYYFAGYLTGLRKARWYGSRTFALGAAFFSSIGICSVTNFPEASLPALFLTAALAVAVWGACQSGGYYRGQPQPGKIALVVSLTCGSFLVLAIFTGLMGALFSQRIDFRTRNYCLSSDGQLCVATTHQGYTTYADLNGKPVTNLATGQRMNATNFAAPFSLGLGENSRSSDWWVRFSGTARFFEVWNSSDKSLWFLDRHGKLIGFNSDTRRHIGDLVAVTSSGAEPLIRPSAGWSEFFDPNYPTYPSQTIPITPSILATASTFYRVDLKSQKLLPLFSPHLGEPIVSYAEYHLAARGANVVAVTRHSINIFDLSGKSIMSMPYQPDSLDYPETRIFLLSNPARYAIWFYPDYIRNKKLEGNLHDRIAWMSDSGEIIKTIELPDLPSPHNEITFNKIVNSLTPLAFQFNFAHHRLQLESKSSLIPSVICALIGWLLARRYRFATLPAFAWVLFLLLLGIPGLLTFFAAQEWPKREICPTCKKLRVVDHENCEHCGAPFAPPDKTGIEIFEPLTAP